MKLASLSTPLVFVVAACLLSPASASTFKRVDLGYLTDESSTVVLGEVVAAESRWNVAANFIVTDVVIRAQESLKGPKTDDGFVRLTLLGGTVGDITNLVVAGGTLEVGARYVLFLKRMELPGPEFALSLPAHAQGIFEVTGAGPGARARSQAARHPLVPDVHGDAAPPGGTEGMPARQLLDSIRQRAASNPPAAKVR